MIVQWRPKAADDFVAIVEAAESVSARAAADQKAIIESKILLLERYPHFGRKTRRPGVRELVLESAPIVIVFRVANGSILILRIFGIETWPTVVSKLQEMI